MVRSGRPREFDQQQALTDARDVFWSRGYEATSVQDLVDALGVQRGSLYAAFGDKRSLYLEAVSLYVRESSETLRALLDSDPLLPALSRLIVAPSAVTGADPDVRRGCLVGNTATQMASDDAARVLVRGAFDGFVELVAVALRRAQEAGEVSAAVPAETQARLLLVLFQGTAVVARGGFGEAELKASVELALQSLRAPQVR